MTFSEIFRKYYTEKENKGPLIQANKKKQCIKSDREAFLWRNFTWKDQAACGPMDASLKS